MLSPQEPELLTAHVAGERTARQRRQVARLLLHSEEARDALRLLQADAPRKSGQALKVFKDLQVACKNYLYTGEGRDRFRDALDAKWPGPLPHTVVIAPGGKVVYPKNG
jgi:hypothetical protein